MMNFINNKDSKRYDRYSIIDFIKVRTQSSQFVGNLIESRIKGINEIVKIIWIQKIIIRILRIVLVINARNAYESCWKTFIGRIT